MSSLGLVLILAGSMLVWYALGGGTLDLTSGKPRTTNAPTSTPAHGTTA